MEFDLFEYENSIRKYRSQTQQLFLINIFKCESKYSKKFIVIGTCGNIYNVIINQTPSCNCPDFEKGFRCKHIYFVLIKILKINSELVDNTYFSRYQLSQFFNNIQVDSHLINQDIKSIYDRKRSKYNNVTMIKFN